MNNCKVKYKVFLKENVASKCLDILGLVSHTKIDKFFYYKVSRYQKLSSRKCEQLSTKKLQQTLLLPSYAITILCLIAGLKNHYCFRYHQIIAQSIPNFQTNNMAIMSTNLKLIDVYMIKILAWPKLHTSFINFMCKDRKRLKLQWAILQWYGTLKLSILVFFNGQCNAVIQYSSLKNIINIKRSWKLLYTNNGYYQDER